MAEKFSDSLSSDHMKLKIPSGDSPYVRAKHVQLVEKDPNRAVALFWCAINSADRVDSALKDMAVVMKQLNRSEEAIEAIKSFRGLCSLKAQEPLDNVLLDLYKKCGRVTEQVELLNHKLKMIDEGIAFGGRVTKTARSQGKKFHVTVEQEKSRLLGNLAWAYMQCENYKQAEQFYRKALEMEKDYNKMCNLAICLMHTGKLAKAKNLLVDVNKPTDYSDRESYKKSFERAYELMNELESLKATSQSNPVLLSNSSAERKNTDKGDEFQKEEELSSGLNEKSLFHSKEKKSWADMVEEEESSFTENQQSMSGSAVPTQKKHNRNPNSFEAANQNKISLSSELELVLLGSGGKSCEDSDYFSVMGGKYSCGKQRHRLQAFQEITQGNAKA